MEPVGSRARRMAMLASVAEENHLKPVIDQGPRGEPSVSVVLSVDEEGEEETGVAYIC